MAWESKNEVGYNSGTMVAARKNPYRSARFFLTFANNHNFLRSRSRIKFLVSRIMYAARYLHFYVFSFWNFWVPYQYLIRLGRVPKNSTTKKLFAKMERSRRVHNRRYQELYSAPRTKKVVIILQNKKKTSRSRMFFFWLRP